MFNIKKFSLYCLVFSLCFFYVEVEAMKKEYDAAQEETENLKNELKALLKASKDQDITRSLIDLHMTPQKFDEIRKICNQEEQDIITSFNFQLKINFSEACHIISQKNPNKALPIAEVYNDTFRWNQYTDSGSYTIKKAQMLLDFIFDKNKENIQFARAMEIAMLGSYFLRHIDRNINTRIFPFVISFKMLFNALQDQDKIDFLQSFGTIGAGEQSITISREHDIPLIAEFRNKGEGKIYTYQQRVVDYLEKLKNSGQYNQNLILLTGLYFLKLQFTGSDKHPEGNLGGFLGKGRLIENKDDLSRFLEKKDIKNETKKWKAGFKNFQEEQKKPEEEQKIKKDVKKEKKEEKNPELTFGQKVKKTAKSPYFYIPVGLGLVSIISYYLYKNWESLKNRFGR